jgi:DNA-binding NtrC family response regulator
LFSGQPKPGWAEVSKTAAALDWKPSPQKILEFGMTRRILLVDDELAILLTLKAILEMNGFEVETATSAREAKQKLSSSTFEMVISDMRMENETSGFEVIRAARLQDYNPATAILTAYPNTGNDWKSEGAESLLVKPMNTSDLLRQIEALLVTHQDSKQAAHKPEMATSSRRNGAAVREGRKAI